MNINWFLVSSNLFNRNFNALFRTAGLSSGSHGEMDHDWLNCLWPRT